MPIKTKSMIIMFTAELGATCLLGAGMVWEVRQNALSAVAAQPITIASQDTLQPPAPFQPSATPFLPPPATAAVSTDLTSEPETFLRFPFESDNNALTPLPGSAPDTTPAPGIPLASKSPLNATQKLVLEIVSRRYIALTTADGIRVAQGMNFVGKNGHPSNMCGPLSISILREAGIISPDTPIEKFWLLNPKHWDARQLLARTFPKERFDDLRFKTPLNKFDWNAFPLQAGDFLYIYAGQGGNFEHMLVVNRVDSKQRAFAVTNYATPNGFIISEVLLYDPNYRDLGIFHTWTKQYYARLGSTGFGGFEVWRLR